MDFEGYSVTSSAEKVELMRGCSSTDRLMCHRTVSAGDSTGRISGREQERCSLFVLYSTEESAQSKINEKYITMLYSVSVLRCV